MAKEPGEWVEKDAYVMPVLPKALNVDPVVAALLHVVAFLELSGDETVNPDWAIEAMEHVAHYLQQLPPKQIEKLQEQIERVAEHAREKKWGAEAEEFFAEFLDNFGVGADED